MAVTTVQPQASAQNNARRLSLPARMSLHTVLVLFSVVMVAPFMVMFVISLVPESAFLRREFGLENWTLDNYVEVFRQIPFPRFYFNSIVVTLSVTAGQLLISSLAAFAFARLRFKGREALFMLYLATLMIPFLVTMIPNFLIIKSFGWYNTYLALIVPGFFSVFSTFLLRQYFRGLPMDLDEAARMDGASSLRIWWQVILPLSGPVLAALAIFTFQGTWNEFLWPLIVTGTQEMQTIPVGLSYFNGQYKTAWGLLMAGSVISLLPVLVVYVLAQNWFVKGIALSGLGGR